MSAAPAVPDIIALVPGVSLLGRSETASVRLPHPSVSRHHAELHFDGRLLRVRDLGGAGGTKVNGVRIREAPVPDGARVEFGLLAYEYRAGRLRRLAHTTGAALELRQVTVAVGERVILQDVTLGIRANAFVGILGPSGAGKSTLLKCLACYWLASSGQVLFDGVPQAQAGAGAALAGYVPQDDLVQPTLTCAENLRYSLALRVGDLTRAEQENIVQSTLDMVGLGKKANERAAKISGGERKRLNVALELLVRPRVLFLDEPTAGLDPANETSLMGNLREVADRGTTVVCATHVLENLMLFDQVLVIAGRTVQFNGPPQNLLGHFKVQNFPALYTKLERIPAPPSPAKPVSSATPEMPSQRLDWKRAAGQVAVLLRRGLHLLIRDPALLVLLLAQPVLIGLLINLSQLELTSYLKATFLFGVVTAIWLGLNNTAREIVRDRPLQMRERMLGVALLTYLTAKLLLFALIGAVQVGLLALVIRCNFLAPGDQVVSNWADCGKNQVWQSWPAFYFWFVLWTTYLSAMLLGLFVSALARTQEAAVAALPLLLLPQLLLTDVATGLESPSEGSFRSLGVLVRANENRKLWSRTRGGLELVSLATFSRPATVLLQKRERDDPPAGSLLAVDWLHQASLGLLTSCGLLAALHWSERRRLYGP